MPTREVTLTEELDRFVLNKVGSGRYENASDAIRAALRTKARPKSLHETALNSLVAAFRFSRLAWADLLEIAEYTFS